MLSNDERKAILDGRWEVDCPRMELLRSVDGSLVSSGPGYIRLGNGGRISFKLFGSLEIEPGVYTFGGSAGIVIPQNEYYSLKAWDHQTREWTAERLLPSQDLNLQLSSAVFHGGISELLNVSITPRDKSRASVSLDFFGDYEIPCNEQTRSVISVADSAKETSFKLNAAKFTACDNEFLIQKRRDALTCYVTLARSDAPENVAALVTDALRFVIAKRLFWSLGEVWQANQCRLTIRSSPSTVSDQTLLPPPLNFIAVESEGKVWRLFESYFRHLSLNSGTGAPQLSALVASTLEASHGSLQAWALTLGVNVEALLRGYFKSLGESPAVFREELMTARQLVRDSKISSGTRQRIDGALGNLGAFRAKQALQALVERGAIDERGLEAWETLRNSAAHGRTVDLDLQASVDLTYRLAVLFYRLIFTAIGYDGSFTDYGIPGWPNRPHQRVDL